MIQIGERYRHFKTGKIYKIIALGKHSETLEDVVIYAPEEDLSQVWVRPYAMFEEGIVINGAKRKRFEQIS